MTGTEVLKSISCACDCVSAPELRHSVGGSVHHLTHFVDSMHTALHRVLLVVKWFYTSRYVAL